MGCPVTVACGSPPDGSVGTPYTHTFPTTGGPNLFFAITSGALPDGLELDPATGEVTGTPTATGVFAFTVTVIDAQVMAAGDDGSFSDFKIAITSDDGSTWARQTTAITDSGQCVIYSEVLGLWIMGTNGASSTEQIQTSPDGVSGNWTAVSTPADNRAVYSLEAGANSVVAVYKNASNQIDLMYTTDGSTWTAATRPSGSLFQSSDVAYSPELGRFVCVDTTDGGGNAGALYSDDDGVNWTFASKINNLTSRAVTWGNGLFVSVGGPSGSGEHLQYSADGINWTIPLTPPGTNPGGSSQGLADVHFANGVFVAVSDSTSTSPGNQAVYSTDGINWTLASTPTGKHWVCVTFGYGFWIAGDSGSASTQPLMTSTDNGVTWSLVSALGFSYGFINGIAFGPVNNCSDSANCSITITGAMLGNTWRGGMQQRMGNTFC